MAPRWWRRARYLVPLLVAAGGGGLLLLAAAPAPPRSPDLWLRGWRLGPMTTYASPGDSARRGHALPGLGIRADGTLGMGERWICVFLPREEPGPVRRVLQSAGLLRRRGGLTTYERREDREVAGATWSRYAPVD